MTHVLGRVTRDGDRPRGPDVELTVRVPADWLRQGATVEVELPRNLACATCRGGGCDTCGRAGAVSLRGRRDEPESIEVTLPAASQHPAEAPPRGVVIRIPEQGGLPLGGVELPRGNLLLRVQAGDGADVGVTRVRRTLLSRIPPGRPIGPVSMRSILLGALVVVITVLVWRLLL